MNAISEWDLGILDAITRIFRCDFLDPFNFIFSFLSDAGWIWIALAVVFLCFKKTRKAGLTLGIALIIGLLVANIGLKPSIARMRPWTYVAEFHPEHVNILEALPSYFHVPSDLSFPSGHAVASVECALVLFFWKKKVGIPALVVAALTCFSRLYFNVHYPTDVMAGILLGIGVAFLAHFLGERLWAFIEKKVAARKLARKNETPSEE